MERASSWGNQSEERSHHAMQMWDDAAVRNIHYIIDKPWERRPEPGSRYAELHQLWWDLADSTPALQGSLPSSS